MKLPLQNFFILFFCVFAAHQVQSQRDIIENAITTSGLDKMKNASASFTFRDHSYQYHNNKGVFNYTRQTIANESESICDVYTNNEFQRYIDDIAVSVSEEKQQAYSNSINSVMYFAFLPLWLQDPAVVLEDHGTVTIKETVYHKIGVTFNENGGGTDFDDEFLYYFRADNYSMDYLAYKYYTNDGGIRFREAFNKRSVNGVFIQDYRNLKPKERSTFTFENIEEAYKNNLLQELSIIELTDLEITFLSN